MLVTRKSNFSMVVPSLFIESYFIVKKESAILGLCILFVANINEIAFDDHSSR
jgi:hypothetical protein